MGTLNQVQKGQGARKGACNGAHKGDGDSEPSAKRSRRAQRCAQWRTQRYAQGGGDSELWDSDSGTLGL